MRGVGSGRETKQPPPLTPLSSPLHHPSAVPLPPVPAPVAHALASALAPCIATGALSKLQVEGVLAASAKHGVILPDGARCGFVLGDGAGVGKGRQLAAIALAHQVRVHAREREAAAKAAKAAGGGGGESVHPPPPRARPARSVWVSTTRDLLVDAQRDFDALTGGFSGGVGGGGAQATLSFGGGGGGGSRNNNPRASASSHVRLFNGPDDALAAGTSTDGVLFVTYTTLARKASTRGAGTPARLDQIVSWCAAASQTGRPADFDGCLIFDESHKAKTWPAGAPGGGEGGDEGEQGPAVKGAKPSATALAVAAAQARLPKARVVYGKEW